MPSEYENFQKAFKKGIICICQKKFTLIFGKLLMIKQKIKQTKPSKQHCLIRLGKALNWKIQA